VPALVNASETGVRTGTRADICIAALEASVYTVPTEVPEADDGTLAWTSTTMVLVRARAEDGTVGTGWTYGAPACARIAEDSLAPIVRGCATWNGSTTTCASNRCSSRARSIPEAARSPRATTPPGTA
jgi:hypothetical protein